MKLVSGKRMMVGTAVMMLSLGMPLMAQAGSSYDYRDRSDVDPRGWFDSHSNYDANRDRYYDNRQFYTDQYGDLDTMEDQKRDRRYRDEGYVSQEGYRSTASTRNPRYPNDLRRADETIRRDILSELGEGTERVQVSVENGVATLSGMVLNREAMVEAVEDAYSGGARKVRNELRIFRYDERPWGEMSDRNLAKAVREELAWSPYVDEDPIRVNARRGIVTLQGTVKDRSEMAAAVENAYEAGARRVNNQLRVTN